jgi:hypothetical protein
MHNNLKLYKTRASLKQLVLLSPHFQLLKYTIIRYKYNSIRKLSVSNIKEKQAGALLLKNHKLYLPRPTTSEPFMILSLLHLLSHPIFQRKPSA